MFCILGFRGDLCASVVVADRLDPASESGAEIGFVFCSAAAGAQVVNGIAQRGCGRLYSFGLGSFCARSFERRRACRFLSMVAETLDRSPGRGLGFPIDRDLRRFFKFLYWT